MTPKTYRLAVVGATGAVGVEFLRCLASRHFPVASLRLLASARSSGKSLMFDGQALRVETLSTDSFADIDIAFFSAGGSISREFAPAAVKAGAIVIDNSSVFRMDPSVPLVVPEVNPEAADAHKGIIANPNCSTIIALTPLWPIHKQNRIRRLIVSTYQAASGAGAAGMLELEEATRASLSGKTFAPKVFPHPYAFNLFSHNTKIDPLSLYNEEELKMANETHKIFGDSSLRISATCVRVPVLRAHSEAINFECERPLTPEKVTAYLKDAPGVRIVDDPGRNYFPMPIEASGQDDVLVGRIRQDASDPSGKSIALFVSGDQLLKGAALNGVQIAETMIARHLL